MIAANGAVGAFW